MEDNNITFVVGNVSLKDAEPSTEDMMKALKKIESLMLEFGIIKIDVCINPWALPTYVKDF